MMTPEEIIAEIESASDVVVTNNEESKEVSGTHERFREKFLHSETVEPTWKVYYRINYTYPIEDDRFTFVDSIDKFLQEA